MLGKLMKHEWCTVWKIPTVLLGILLLLSVMAGATFCSDMWQSELEGLDILLVLVLLLYYFAVIGVSLAVTLYLAVRFYKSMFTDEGYLTHTLPVSTHQLLLSKLLVMAAWTFLVIVGIVISLMLAGSMAVFFLKPQGTGFWEVISVFLTEIEELVGEAPGMLLYIVIMGITGVFSGPMLIIGSVCVGQLVGKHKVLGSIGAYFAINTIVQFLTTFVMVLFLGRATWQVSGSGEVDNVFAVLSPTYAAVLVISIATTIGLYFLSEYLIRRKLNLD